MAAIETEEPHLPPVSDHSSGPLSLLRFVAAMSWMHQFALSGLAVAVFLLEVVPLELQRRIVNDLVEHRSYRAIVLLCVAYAGTALVHGLAKLALKTYRGWVGERAKRDLRRRICGLVGITAPPATLPGAQGTAVSMIVAEVEPIGAFVGSAIAEPLLHAGVLATVITYLIHIDVSMGVAALALTLPQFVFVPLMQRAINRRTGVRVWLLRHIGAGVLASRNHCEPADRERIDHVFRINMRIFELKFTMTFLMNLLLHLQIVAVFLLGGWRALQGDLEIGSLVAFISGVGRLARPWRDLVNYVREAAVTRVKFSLLGDAIEGRPLNRTAVRRLHPRGPTNGGVAS